MRASSWTSAAGDENARVMGAGRGHRQREFPSGVLATLIMCLVVSLLATPGVANADLAADIATAFQGAINSLNGTEIDPVTVGFAYKPPDLPFPPTSFDSVHVEMTYLGFAFCDPPDPWVDPISSPTAPSNAYGCVNDAMVTASTNPGLTESTVLIEVSDFFFDFAYTRAKTLACGELAVGEVASDAYLVTANSFSVTLSLETVGTCMQASLVPGSLVLELEEKKHGFHDDTCLTVAWSLFSGVFFNLIDPAASATLEATLLGAMTEFNTALCSLTPVENTTWGVLKSRYR